MKFQKLVLDEIYRCYCTSSVTIDGELHLLLASEEVDGPCYAYSGPDFSRKEVVWEHAGGTMSIVEIPGTNGEFLAVQNFFPGFKSATAKIVWGRYDRNQGWIIRDLIQLPYVHRFDILSAGGTNYFMGATLCTSKKEREDWSDPGKVYVGELPKDLNQPLVLQPILEGLCRNHGYSRGVYQGKMAGYVTCDQGIFVVAPPDETTQTWTVHQLADWRVSDVAVFDLDGDGAAELVTIEPFHGDQFKIYHAGNGGYQAVYHYPGEIEFAHAVWAGLLRGRPVVIGGIRRKNCELFMVEYQPANPSQYETTLIETGGGPSNVAIVNQKERDLIICANHTRNEAALYIVTD